MYFVFFALCSPPAQSLTMVHFAWSWTCSDTSTLRQDASQNRLWNGWAIVEVSEFVFRVFCLMLTICSVTYYGPFCTFLPSFRYPRTLLLSIESAFKQWWPFWVRIQAITRQFTQSVRPCSVDYKNVDRRLQILDKDYKIPDCGKPSTFMGERQSSTLVLLKKSVGSGVINKSLRKLRGLIMLTTL